ncbi:MAG: SGNH/GDSL hydrolase family protein, partial [Spirochaetia bacterium]|nr:SGNH/GDSL hydrolase family protein [Spirochaetia bacterium]
MVSRIIFILAMLLGNFIFPAERFREGDRVAFIGDSITHGGIYFAWVNEFYLTRFPSEKIIFINNGISGDTASGANSRFDWDIMTGKPNAAAIMLGMNDVNRPSYGVESPNEEILKRQTDALNSYKTNTVTLAARLQTNKVRLTFITPSPYDQTASLKEKNLFGVNGALSNCGEFLKARALDLKAGLVDFNGPMTSLNAQIQATNVEATLVGRDRVHPGGLGHLVMAWLFLKAQGMTSTVANVDIDADAKRVTSENASVDDLKIADEGLSFVYRARSLPLPVNDDYRAVDALVPLTTDLNVETIRIRNLASGSWTLSMNGTNLGIYSAEAFAAGINIATNLLSPGQLQAQMIQKLNRDRW